MLNLYFFKLKIKPEMNENSKNLTNTYQQMNETTGEINTKKKKNKKLKNSNKNWNNSLLIYPATDNCKQLLSCELVSRWNDAYHAHYEKTHIHPCTHTLATTNYLHAHPTTLSIRVEIEIEIEFDTVAATTNIFTTLPVL